MPQGVGTLNSVIIVTIEGCGLPDWLCHNTHAYCGCLVPHGRVEPILLLDLSVFSTKESSFDYSAYSYYMSSDLTTYLAPHN